MATHRTILNVPDIFADARIAAHHWFRAHGFQSALLIPIVLDDLMCQLLATAPAERPPNAETVADELRRIAAELTLRGQDLERARSVEPALGPV